MRGEVSQRPKSSSSAGHNETPWLRVPGLEFRACGALLASLGFLKKLISFEWYKEFRRLAGVVGLAG